MKNKTKVLMSSIFMLAAVNCAYAADANMSAAEPTRWSVEDATPQQRYQTAKKEATAAYRENTTQCKALPGAERASCLREARTLFQQESADAKRLLSGRDQQSGQ